MNKQMKISTLLGTVHLEMKERVGTMPVIFLHGIYFDRHLWDAQIAECKEHTTIAIDMPHHGENTDRPNSWNLDDCATMLIEVLDRLHMPRVIAIGHSWGSMTILRAAVRAPARFAAIGLCNMPLQKGSKWKLPGYYLVSMLLPFRDFYCKQVAKVQFAADSLKSRPHLLARLKHDMSKLSNADIRRVDVAVRIIQDDGYRFVRQLNVPALALKGVSEYVPAPPGIDTTLVPGGHISPLEAPDEVTQFVRDVIASGTITDDER